MLAEPGLVPGPRLDDGRARTAGGEIAPDRVGAVDFVEHVEAAAALDAGGEDVALGPGAGCSAPSGHPR